MTKSEHPRRWPACGIAVLLMVYAVGKAVFAVQARLGFPSGPVVSTAEQENYFLGAATAQWLAAATGVAGAAVALTTVTAIGRRLPRTLMLVTLAGMLAGVGAGAGVMALDGFIGIGVGWQWYHGLVGTVAIGLLVAMIHSYLTATRRRHVAD